MAKQINTKLFKAAAPAADFPTQFDINDGQQWLNAVAGASASHKVTRWQGEKSPVQVTVEGGDTLTVFPAGSQDEFFAQRDALIRAFREEVGRYPQMGGNADDRAFWQAVSAIYQAYQGPTLDPGAVTGGLS